MKYRLVYASGRTRDLDREDPIKSRWFAVPGLEGPDTVTRVFERAGALMDGMEVWAEDIAQMRSTPTADIERDITALRNKIFDRGLNAPEWETIESCPRKYLEEYLVYDSEMERTFVAKWLGIWRADSGLRLDKPTHWMAMPEDPESV